jgi:signal transduction histidine kinase
MPTNAPGAEGQRAKRTRAASARARPARVPRKPREPREHDNGAPPSSASGPQPQRGRDPLLAAICHDLRAPLAAVTMGTNFVLQTTQRDPANARSVKILEAMLRSCTQMERLIRNFADLSEIEGDSLTLRLGLHDAGEMAELAANAMAENARARSVTLDVRKANPPITVTCDRDRFLRALGHIVENAVKVAPEGSTVTIAVSQRGDEVCFAVTDHGEGLSPQVKKNLYDRHWHAKRANRVGAGFGLAIARGFLAAHGGHLDVDSHPGSMTTFTLCTPTRGPADGRVNGAADA